MRTLSYILLSSILLFAPLDTAAQKKQEKGERVSLGELLAFKGVGISADIFGCAYSLIGEGISTEVAAEVNFGNRLYPTAEFGWAWCNTTDESSNIHYRTNAPYYRAGFNYNFLTSKENPNPKHYIYGLMRFGWTNFKYDVQTPPITDPVWGGTVALDLEDVDGACM